MAENWQERLPRGTGDVDVCLHPGRVPQHRRPGILVPARGTLRAREWQPISHGARAQSRTRQTEVAMTWRQQNSKRAEGVLPTITEAAAAQVLDSLQSRNIPEDVAPRVNLADQVPVFEVGQKRTDDMMFASQGRVILC